ncbi:MAG: Uma2 family endonuclease [Candidatus Tectomicrobia bacterium]|uniref:Uma2 family endonuclease n=1 Tax=Tectimicrobiota bacterium TaxID=2528274 RepID=A0A938B309_UNCTE|nr:Uma2 family endonuclease [Candidatus Tectomicrobia bacterium]
MALSTVASATDALVYPERDGKPMGETDVHIDAVIYLREALKYHFRTAPQIYVAGNLLLYYEEHNPAVSIAPDVMVVHGVPKHERRTYKLWEEGQPPSVVFEVTSRSSRVEDVGTKRAIYAMLGVQEYFIYDPFGEYLRPPLQGYRLEGDDYQHLAPTGVGQLTSHRLGLDLRLEAGRLRLVDATTGERLFTHEEAQNARQQAEARIAQAEARAAQEAAARQAAEAELQRLRALLDSQQREG